ncbi:hypothetical protein ACFYNN_34450 [Streptomyces sp. NPDC006978]|uniref:hypothetical protein n=1 Tax=unclassified Streptomyces TaxID=2593676 RepID=UPI0036A0DC14
MRSLLTALSDQLPAQLGTAGVGFNLVNHADGNRVLAVICSPDDELMALIDTTDSPSDRGSADYIEYENAMLSRGWHAAIPVARWYEATHPRGAEGATAMATLIVRELRHRTSGRPIDLGLSDLSVNKILDTGLGPELGRLFLPGLGVNA